ncbi:MAG TPA: glycogen/starch/alpha-glucan phosphorylase [Dissulfurispiraceae bacterium]|nr:glycogen/starch/alpha-glucan phosphorylase [Dissulfurispiraceae bacterium]
MRETFQFFHKAILDHLIYSIAKDRFSATQRDKFVSFSLSVRDLLIERWINTQQTYYTCDAKRVYYLSLEFMMGKLLESNITNLGLVDDYRYAANALGMTYDEIADLEEDAGLGNGGLGRLAACFLDSMASLGYPGYGYGIRYEYGIFSQRIRGGYQVETPDSWLRYGNPWEIPRPEVLYPVKFYGHVDTVFGRDGRMRMHWSDAEDVMAMAYDYPVPGFRNETVNNLRLWAAKSSREFNLEYFNSGDYVKAVEDKTVSENISKVLYPDDQSFAGKELRLKQQYFFVSATLRDILRRYKKYYKKYDEFPNKVAIQLNDTHPSIAIPELMRILVDEDDLEWEEAWQITTRSFAYTNHTILPEALETWSEGLMGHLLPRHLQIIKEIDRRFLVEVGKTFSDDPERSIRMAIITGDGERWINMARLAIVGSHTVNGVSQLHSDILKNDVFHDFHIFSPGKFRNVTNGITPRKWLIECNRPLAALISEAIGDGWMQDLGRLAELEPFAGDAEFRRRFREIKEGNKKALAAYIEKKSGLTFPSEFLLDCQVKRLHEYKRQLLNIFHVITLYNRIREGGADTLPAPRTVLFAGKSAPGYYMCKLIIKLIHSVGEAIEKDPRAHSMLKVVFVPNYGVTIAQRIMPAAELSEQISTAGFEASGTGNMKFALNGALTIGTLDGANVEIREEAGVDNFFLFGLTADEIIGMRHGYNPRHYYEKNPELHLVINQLLEGYFSPDDRSRFHPIARTLLDGDRFFVLADYASYIDCQQRVGKAYADREKWTKMAILNVARSGKFSSDRAIKEYADDIWHIEPIKQL